MPKKRFSAEQIVTLLRQIEVAMGQGKSTQIACRDTGISEQSYYRWRKEYGGLQMVDILTAVLTDGLSAVEAACAEAIAHSVHSADVVLNILARQRDPGPQATILTPAALTLRHAPVANCARYDNLRRMI